jgi:broad specificity phosphatase PhoE
LKRITIIRHGESEGNIDQSKYETIPDSLINLTENGQNQAAGLINELPMCLLLRNSSRDIQKIPQVNLRIIYSPYIRAVDTMNIMTKNLIRIYPSLGQCLSFQESILLREQEWPTLKPIDQIDKEIQRKKELKEAGYYFRFLGGESCADTELRLRIFLQQIDPATNDHLFLFCHGEVEKILVKILLNLTVSEYYNMPNLKNCEFVTLNREKPGSYSLDSSLSHSEPQRLFLNSLKAA